LPYERLCRTEQLGVVQRRQFVQQSGNLGVIVLATLLGGPELRRQFGGSALDRLHVRHRRFRVGRSVTPSSTPSKSWALLGRASTSADEGERKWASNGGLRACAIGVYDARC